LQRKYHIRTRTLVKNTVIYLRPSAALRNIGQVWSKRRFRPPIAEHFQPDLVELGHALAVVLLRVAEVARAVADWCGVLAAKNASADQPIGRLPMKWIVYWSLARVPLGSFGTVVLHCVYLSFAYWPLFSTTRGVNNAHQASQAS
jgi:hypothetical protein